MPQILITTPFKFAHHGFQVEEFTPGEEPVETTDECAALAVAEGWATCPVVEQTPEQQSVQTPEPEAEKPPADGAEVQAHDAAPENRDAAKKRNTRASA